MDYRLSKVAYVLSLATWLARHTVLIVLHLYWAVYSQLSLNGRSE